MKNNLKFLFAMWVSLYSLTVKGQCVDPTNLAYSYSNGVSTFTWDAVPGAVSYDIEFKYPGAAYSWSYPEYVASSTTNSFDITGTADVGSTTLEYRVRAVCSATSSSNFAVSQFTIPCLSPTNLSLVSATNTSATLSWTEEQALLYPGAYRVSYRVLNSGAPWTLAGSGYFNTITVNNLLSGTTYEWCVNRTCGYFWSDPAVSQFTTVALPPCVAPSNLNAANITTNSALLTWDAVSGATGYVLQYSNVNAWVSVNVQGTSFPLSGLSNNTLYAFRVLSVCANNAQSALSANFNFTTSNAAVCNNVAVTNLQASAAANNGVLLTWDVISLVSGYVVEYKLASASSWIVIPNVPLNSYVANGLALGANYNFRVKAFCTNNSTSYANVNYVTASAPLPQTCNSSGVNTFEFIDLFKLGSINRSSGAEAGGYVNTGLTTDLVIGSNNSAQFSAGFSGASRTQNYAVYIDFNRNGNFSDVGERVFGVGFVSNGSVRNFNITVPTSATAGPAALRVIMVKSGVNVTPCMNSFLGEVEDYTVNLTSGSLNKTQDPSLDDQLLSAATTLNKNTELVIYPNPSNGLFNISLAAESKYSHYEVYSIEGKSIISNTMSNNEAIKIDLLKNAKGLYLLHIIDVDGKRTYHKLFKE